MAMAEHRKIEVRIRQEPVSVGGDSRKTMCSRLGASSVSSGTHSSPNRSKAEIVLPKFATLLLREIQSC